MRSVATKVFAFSAVILSLVVAGNAQQKPMDPNDPRTGLKPGLRDAGVAASGMELVSTRPRASSHFFIMPISSACDTSMRWPSIFMYWFWVRDGINATISTACA